MKEPRRLAFIIYPVAEGSFWIRPSGISSLVGIDGIIPLEMDYGKTIAMHRMAALMTCEEAGSA